MKTIKYIAFMALFASVMAVCACSDDLASSRTDEQKERIRELIAEGYTVVDAFDKKVPRIRPIDNNVTGIFREVSCNGEDMTLELACPSSVLCIYTYTLNIKENPDDTRDPFIGTNIKFTYCPIDPTVFAIDGIWVCTPYVYEYSGLKIDATDPYSVHLTMAPNTGSTDIIHCIIIGWGYWSEKECESSFEPGYDTYRDYPFGSDDYTGLLHCYRNDIVIHQRSQNGPTLTGVEEYAMRLYNN